MADKDKKKKIQKKSGESEESSALLKEETWHAIWSILCFALSIFLTLAAFNKAGVVGSYTFRGLTYLFGSGYYLLPLVGVMLGVSFLKAGKPRFMLINTLGGVGFIFSGLGLMELFVGKGIEGVHGYVGGLFGYLIYIGLIKLFGAYATGVFLIALLLVSILVVFESRISIAWFIEQLKKLFVRAPKEEEDEPVRVSVNSEEDSEYLEAEGEELATEEESQEATADEQPKNNGTKEKVKKMLGLGEGEAEGFATSTIGRFSRREHPLPPLSLLSRDSGKPLAGDIKANSNIIKRTLQNFGIEVEMDEITIGPSITRYALKPAEGVKLSKIVGLQNDLSMALAAHPLRIEAPIPGKSLVGIEIPNTTKTTVRLGSLLESRDFAGSSKPLFVSLGRDISGAGIFSDLAKMPHALIAGTTGSGKSVTIHTVITSLLFRNSPEALRFIMIDPKRVELTLYNKIPHLLTPVITDAKKTIFALKWAAKEMDRRYDILEAESVRDIQSYHENVLRPAVETYRERLKAGGIDEEESAELESKLPETMPYIVIIIDELADIMTTYPREMEAAVVRLAQMSRAVGIHLILSTQRPSTEVITGLIKANIPSRIALQVPSQIDSRTIIDMPGAEKLLGSGDMLYISGEMSKPKRIQSAFISESEVKQVVKFFADAYKDELPQEVNITDPAASGGGSILAGGNVFSDDEGGGDDDELYEQAREIVISSGKASSSLLQRKLKVGYARAARLLDMLEERGVVGPGDGAKPREVYGSTGSVVEELASDLAEDEKHAQ